MPTGLPHQTNSSICISSLLCLEPPVWYLTLISGSVSICGIHEFFVVGPSLLSLRRQFQQMIGTFALLLKSEMSPVGVLRRGVLALPSHGSAYWVSFYIMAHMDL